MHGEAEVCKSRGTAIGTGVAARLFCRSGCSSTAPGHEHRVCQRPKLIEATQNADVYVEVSGVLKTLAATLWKICSDLRLLASGPLGGLGELRLPERQAGSSIMPGKVNPVIPEAVTQSAMRVFGHDESISLACASGCLELNPFLPLVATSLLESIDLLARSATSSDGTAWMAWKPTRSGAVSAWSLPPRWLRHSFLPSATLAPVTFCRVRNKAIGRYATWPATLQENPEQSLLRSDVTRL